MTRCIAALLFAVLAVYAAPPSVAEVGPELADQFDCAACHTERLREFRRRGAATLVEHEPQRQLDTGRQDAASTPDMCLSCHDGFVLDSRSLWKQGHLGHPLGMTAVEGDLAVVEMLGGSVKRLQLGSGQ